MPERREQFSEGQALEEAAKMRPLVESGKVETYGDAEKKVEDEKSLLGRTEEAYQSLETDEGRESLTYKAVMSGIKMTPEFVELALRHKERYVPKPWSEKNTRSAAAKIAKEFSQFNLPESRLQEIEINARKHSQLYENAETEFDAFNKRRSEQDEERLLEARKQGYELNGESAKRAAQEGDFELAHLIYTNIPGESIPHDAGLEGIYSGMAAVDTVSRFNDLVQWSKDHEPRMFQVIRNRTDEVAKYWDRRDPITRHHSLNMAPLYQMLGDLEEMVRRIEPNPQDRLNYLDKEHPLRKKLTELEYLYSELTQRKITPEQLRARSQG